MARICYGLALLFSQTNAFSQEKITITPELLEIVKKSSSINNLQVYPVISKEVDYYPYVEGQVNTREYNLLLERLKELKPHYDKYRVDVVKDSSYRSDIETVVGNIDKYLTSNEKSEIKANYLIEAQAIANKHNIEVQGNRNSFITQSLNNYGGAFPEKKTYILHNGKKSSSKGDIEFYKQSIQNMEKRDVYASHEAKKYMELLNEEKTIQKTQSGQVRSDKKSKRIAYFIAETPLDVNMLIGEFEISANKYLLNYKDVENKYSKNELSVNDRDSNRLSILKKIDSGEMFYVTAEQFLPIIKGEIRYKKYLTLGTSAEYKAWKAKYQGLQASAQTNVNACKSIIAKHTYRNRLGEKLYETSTFSSQEKATFNKNLDVLNQKLNQLNDLTRGDYQEFYNYFLDKASIEESVRTSNLSTFYNSTWRA